MEFSLGDKIGGRYQVYHRYGGAGHSGMGVVYVCYDHKQGGTLALKTYQEGFFDDQALVDHFKRGALAWIQLDNHPYVVRAHGVMKLGDQLFLGLEYIAPDADGRNTLSHHLQSHVPLRRALRWSLQFCDAMEHARAKGVTPHRDIKPDNLLITHDGTLKVTDFDLAGLGQLAMQSGVDFINEPGGVAGTRPWMAPEQFDGQSSVQSDIYSFGVVLYQMAAAGRLPVMPGEDGDWAQAHRQAVPAALDSPLWPVIERCLAKEPASRFGAADAGAGFTELRAALAECWQRHLPQTPLPAPPEGKALQAGELNDRGISLAHLGLYQEALKVYQQAIKLKPDHAPTYLNAGVALAGAGDLDKAAKAYQKVMQLDPQIAEAWYNDGLIHKGRGHVQQAEQRFHKALQLQPDMHGASEQLGIVLSEAGRHEEAIHQMQEAVSRDPLYAGYHYSLAVALEKAGQHPRALASYQEAVRLQPNDARYQYGLGNGYRFAGDMRSAVECWSRAVDLEPAQPMAHFNLGRAFEEQGDRERAYAHYHRGSLMDPTVPNPYYNMGLLLAEEQLFGEAVEAFENFIHYAADDQAMAPHVEKASGYIESLRKDEQALQAQMNQHQAVYNRGLANLNLGRLPQAREWIQRALKMKPDYGHALCGLGICYERAGDLAKAVTCYRKSTEVDPAYTIAWNNLGWAQYQLGEYEVARQAYRQFIRVGAEFPDWVARAQQMLIEIDNALGQATASTTDTQTPAVATTTADHATAAANVAEQVPVAEAPKAGQGPADTALVDEIAALYDADQYDQASAALDKALACHGKDARLHNLRGQVLVARGRYDEAIDSYLRAIENQPDYIEAQNNFGLAFLAQEDYDAALDHFQYLVDAYPEDVEARYNLGMSHAYMGQKKKAIKQFKQVLKELPEMELSAGQERRWEAQLEAALEEVKAM